VDECLIQFSIRLTHNACGKGSHLLCSSIQTIAEFCWSRWPYQKSYADRLDATQRKMLGTLFDFKPRNGEPYDAFVQRRHRETGRLATKCGRWSTKWAQA